MKKVKILGAMCWLGFVSNLLYAQSDSTWKVQPVINLSGYVDVFYSYDFNRPQSYYRQKCFVSYNRHNEFNLNLGLVKLSVAHQKYRANLALQAGTYAEDNYAQEQGMLKNVFEANIGLALNRKNNLWLDAGIFASHIGIESAIGIENWNLTRSLLAENSPYYLSGVKATYIPNSKWEMAALICNGWQHIQKVQGNSLPSFGTQLKYTPNKKTVLNWSTFVGTDTPDSTRRMRYFNNFYGQFQLNSKLGFIGGFDVGMQQASKGSSTYDIWYSPVFIFRYMINEKWIAACRAEYYQDKKSVIISPVNSKGINTAGFSYNIDYRPISDLACRMEIRWLYSQNNIFVKEQSFVNNNVFLTASIAKKF